MRASVRWASSVLALGALVIGLTVTVPAGLGVASLRSAFPVGTFETHLDGFTGVGHARVRLSADGVGRNRSRAMVVRTRVRGAAATRSSRRFAERHPAGTTYVVGAWVRVPTTRPVALRVREISGGTVTRVRERRPVVPGRRWTRITTSITTTRADSVLAVGFRTRLRVVERYRVDDLRVTRKPAGDSVAGRLTNGCTYTARGIPSCSVYVGAAHGSNTDPSALEGRIGRQLGIRRTYYTATGVTKAVSTARGDLAAGRLPWISFKLPHSWSGMVAGAGDAWARDLARQLAALDGPVWVAFHHEPEGDGDIQQWRRMQERLAPLVRNGAPNVAFTVIVTGWNQFYGDPAYSLGQIWPRGVKVDVAGFDIYQQYGVVKDGRTTTKWTDFTAYFQKIDAWARTAGVDWALGETGVTAQAIAARPSVIADTVRLLASFGGIGYSYFDTTLNSIADWSLSSAAKVDGFRRATAGTPTLH